MEQALREFQGSMVNGIGKKANLFPQLRRLPYDILQSNIMEML
jgi:hypothetical protein